jgi:hypothetical protein
MSARVAMTSVHHHHRTATFSSPSLPSSPARPPPSTRLDRRVGCAWQRHYTDWLRQEPRNHGALLALCRLLAASATNASTWHAQAALRAALHLGWSVLESHSRVRPSPTATTTKTTATTTLPSHAGPTTASALLEFVARGPLLPPGGATTQGGAATGSSGVGVGAAAASAATAKPDGDDDALPVVVYLADAENLLEVLRSAVVSSASDARVVVGDDDSMGAGGSAATAAAAAAAAASAAGARTPVPTVVPAEERVLLAEALCILGDIWRRQALATPGVALAAEWTRVAKHSFDAAFALDPCVAMRGVVWCAWCVVWCGMVFGVVWCGAVWCGVVWCGVVWRVA